MKDISLVKKASSPGAGGLQAARGGRRDHRRDGFGRGARRERARRRRARRCSHARAVCESSGDHVCVTSGSREM
eukprot:106431-Prymnesium_polylepis.1